ncbi:MAG TPA: hypothetical protein VHK90_17500, partial [Thermoanaerobaculia bacterium]|nr:hypothetical protein [Thermoanaerobaculia bacterium]
MTQTSTAFYFATQHVWRAKREQLPRDELRAFRADLDADDHAAGGASTADSSANAVFAATRAARPTTVSSPRSSP